MFNILFYKQMLTSSRIQKMSIYWLAKVADDHLYECMTQGLGERSWSHIPAPLLWESRIPLSFCTSLSISVNWETRHSSAYARRWFWNVRIDTHFTFTVQNIISLLNNHLLKFFESCSQTELLWFTCIWITEYINYCEVTCTDCGNKILIKIRPY